MKPNIIKPAFVLMAILLFSVDSHLHAQELIGKLYITKVPVVVKKAYADSRLATDPVYDSICEAKKGYVFQVRDLKNEKVIIRWWDFTEASAESQKKQDDRTGRRGIERISYKNTYLDYEISLEDLNSKCIPYYGASNSFTWGAVTMPVKVRPGNKSDRYFSFQESLNIGIAAGWSWQRAGTHQKSTNVLVSIGVSNVTLDSLDFRKINNKRFEPNVRSTAAFTIAGGYVFQFENFQVGAFTGLDILPYELGRQWLHKRKPWIGIGLGMSLFNRNQQESGSGKNTD